MTSWRASFSYVAELDVRTVSRRLPRVVSSTPRFGSRARYTESNSHEDVIQRRTVGSRSCGSPLIEGKNPDLGTGSQAFLGWLIDTGTGLPGDTASQI